MQVDKDMAEFLCTWHGDMPNLVIESMHPQAEVMVLASTVLWSGRGSAPVDFGVWNHD